MKEIPEHLREYDIKLGELETGLGDDVNRESDGLVSLPPSQDGEENVQIYRDAGIDEIFNAVIDLNLGFIEDDLGNVFADSAFSPVAQAYYNLLPDAQAPDVAEMLLRNSTRVEECEKLINPPSDPTSRDPYIGGLSDSDRRKLTDCYLTRIFAFIAIETLINSFPVFDSPGGSRIPIFNILPSKTPNNFSVTFLTALVAKSNADIFSLKSFSVTNLNQENRFEWKKTNPPEASDLNSVFNPKATTTSGNNEDIEFVFDNGNTRGGSGGSVLFEADMSIGIRSSFSDTSTAEISFSDGGTSETREFEVAFGERLYSKTRADDILLHDFSNGDFKLTSTKSTTEQATLDLLTIDNDELEVEVSGPVTFSNASNFLDFLESELDSEYANFFLDGDKVRIGGDFVFIVWNTPDAFRESRPDPVTVLFNLPGYVSADSLDDLTNTGGEPFTNSRNVKIYSGAPFFEEPKGTWRFISDTLNTPPSSSLDQINITANELDPDLGPDDAPDPILDKAFNQEYNGFGADVIDYDTGNRVNAEDSILEDFFNFYKQYVEENFAVIHIGLSNSSPPTPIVSGPKQIEVKLDVAP